MKFFAGFPDSPGPWWLAYRCGLLVLILLVWGLAFRDDTDHWSDWFTSPYGFVRTSLPVVCCYLLIAFPKSRAAKVVAVALSLILLILATDQLHTRWSHP